MCKISVIVPVYNVERYICRCIDSILRQTYSNFQLILVDDGSSDNSGKICDEYARRDSRIRVIHQKNGGLSAARNTGIVYMLANDAAEWLTFIDSDDWIHKKYLEALLYGALQYKVPISMCWQKMTDGEEIEPECFDAYLRTTEEAYTYNGHFIMASACGRLYRKELFSQYRFPQGKLWEDMYLIHKILFQTPKVAVIEQPLYYYYRNPESIVRKKWSVKNWDVINAYEQEIFPYFKNRHPSVYKIARKSYYHEIAGHIVAAQQAGYKKESRKLKRKLRFKMLSYIGKCNFTISEYAWVYELAFPLFMKGYWITKAICRRLKIKGRLKNVKDQCDRSGL